MKKKLAHRLDEKMLLCTDDLHKSVVFKIYLIKVRWFWVLIFLVFRNFFSLFLFESTYLICSSLWLAFKDLGFFGEENFGSAG